MNAPAIWIVFPGFIAGILFLFRRWNNVITYSGAGISLLLAWTAWQVPIGEVLSLGQIALKIEPTLSIFGRDFTLEDSERTFLAVLYLANTLWLLGALIARPGNLFVPLEMGMMSLLIAALAVEPFLYAALLIEIAALLSVPLLASPGKPAGRGVFRFLTFQTLGMPFILFTGWMLAGVDASPGDLDLVVRAGVLMGLGFAFLLPIFPFHSWIPMLAREAHPYVIGFLLVMLPGFVSMFGLGFLNRYSWLRDSEAVYGLLRSIGVIMVVLGGLWAAFQRHMASILGFAVIIEIGLSLLAVGLGTSVGVSIFFVLFLPRTLSIITWAIALTLIGSRTNNDLSFNAVQGLGLKFPYLAAVILLAIFSLAGLPILAGFPVRFALWSNLAAMSPYLAIGALLGSLGLLVGGVRVLSVLVVKNDSKNHLIDNKEDTSITLSVDPLTPTTQVFFLLVGLVLLLVGLVPQWFLPYFEKLSSMFAQLAP
ncbi:MAG: hypothetical protein FVQ83_08810 [Chloroflexi bacterium]|nr:hypothetical protein [Chloroflexota bacterium]